MRMKNKKYLIIPSILLGSYIIYRKFYAIDFKNLNLESHGELFVKVSPLLFSPHDSKSLEERIDEIDWEGVSG